MYAREIEEHPEPLSFGVSGKLIMNVLVMYDLETESLWAQLLGEAVDGPLTGARLTPLAATQTTWANWRELHPDTVALDKGYAGSYDSYAGYYESSQAGVLGESLRDARLPTKELGIGLVVNEQPAYYPFSRLQEERVVNDEVAGQALLVVFDPDFATALSFSRVVEDQELTFSPVRKSASEFILEDEETGSRWNAWTGSATAGPLAGNTLARVPATTSFWFGWKDWYPGTYVFGIPEEQG